MVQRLQPNNARRSKRGFNLIEAAIVLGVVGLVIGGLWVAAASVSENMKVNKTVSDMAFIVTGIQSLISVSDSESIGDWANITSSVINSGAFPQDWVNGHPFGSWVAIQNRTSPGRFMLTLDAVPRSACIKLTAKISSLGNSLSRVDGDTWGTLGLPISLGTAENQLCIHDYNQLSFTYAYTRNN